MSRLSGLWPMRCRNVTRALILLATFGSLRWGELMGLRNSDIDLNEATVSIERSVVEVGGGLVVKEPKTAAGVRTIALPRSLMPEIARHLDRFAEVGADGRVFVGPYGVTPTRRSFGRIWGRGEEGRWRGCSGGSSFP